MSALLQKSGIYNVTVNTMHPGAVKTNFGADPMLNFIGKLARPFFRTAEQGADTLVYLATDDEVAGSSGNYCVDRKEAKVSAKYDSPERDQQVWDYCSRLIGAGVNCLL